MYEWREPTIRMFNMDCMEAMAQMQSKQYDLAIVDPPYGINAGEMQGGKGRNKKWAKGKKWDADIPSASFFNLLFLCSVSQIVWGGNYFALPATKCFIVWDKKNSGRSFADCEMAWTSFSTVARIYRQHNVNIDNGKIHPTQKPTALYKWLLKNYAKPGDKILDTHGGSGSICIACYDMGFDLDWYELDSDYYKAAVERFERHKSQQKLM